jgi:drug/metabolite transporter (DMT)-like permease
MSSTVTIFAATIALNVTAQLLLKLGAARTGISSVYPLSLVNIYSLSAVACLVAALAWYILILQRLPLILAQSFLTLQFAATVLAAAIILGERVLPLQWSGITLIGAGLFLLSR